METKTEKRSVTMQDVAKLVGVAPMTVSRVLNGTGRISPSTRDSVQKAIDELGYKPHLAPKMMREGRSRQIGVLLENRPERRFTHPLAWEFIVGINEGLETGGHMMSMVRVSEVEAGAQWSETALQSRLLDGLIAVNFLPVSIIERLTEARLPCVWVDGNIWNETGCLRRDEELAARLCLENVVARGYKKACVFATPSPPEGTPHYSVTERIAGLEKAARELPVELEWRYVQWKSPTGSFSEAITDSCQRLLREARPETAIVMRDTYLAQSLLVEAAQSAKRIGHDFGLVCLDDHFHEPAYHWNGVSRVSFDRFEMGYRAAQMLLDSLSSGPMPPSQRMGGHFVAGQTLPTRNQNIS